MTDKFEIEATQLNQVLRAAVLPRRGTPFLTIEGSTHCIKVHCADERRVLCHFDIHAVASARRDWLRSYRVRS